MTKEEIAATLKFCRIKAGLDAKDVAEKLISMGSIKSIKSFYNWESGRTQPDADTFMYLCRLYNVGDIMSAFGYKKESSAPAQAETEDGAAKALLNSYTELNAEGREKLCGYADDLVMSGKYTKNNSSEICADA